MGLREAVRAGDLALATSLLTVQGNALTLEDQVAALRDAACYGHLEIIRLLLERVDVNAQAGPHAETALHAAASCERLGVVKYLVEHGADINARNATGETPLHRALGMELTIAIDLTDELGYFIPPNGQTSALLIGLGADVNAKNNHGETPLDYANEVDHLWAIRLLREHGAVEGSASQAGS